MGPGMSPEAAAQQPGCQPTLICLEGQNLWPTPCSSYWLSRMPGSSVDKDKSLTWEVGPSVLSTGMARGKNGSQNKTALSLCLPGVPIPDSQAP